MKKFPSFWYDSNAYFGRINNIADLKKAIHDTEKTLRQYLTENGVNLEKL